MVTGVLEGKTALIVGVANKRSIAWSIAQKLSDAGARCAFTFQAERIEDEVRKLAESLPNPGPVLPLDVQDADQMKAAVSGAADGLGGGIDILVHAVAFARADDLGGRFIDTDKDGFELALDISAYSLAALARETEPYMAPRGGGSIMALSYIAAERAVPGYNVMGVAKSTLESIVRYLAWDLGDKQIRVNAISAGPVRTLAARSIPGFNIMVDKAEERAPLRRSITAEEVAGAGLFLASDLSSGITGSVLYVDAGYHSIGL